VTNVKKVRFLFAVASFAAALAIAHESAASPVPWAANDTVAHSAGGAPPPADRNPRYRICASDVIAVTFPLTPEFDQTVNVEPDGFVALAGAGSVRLAGLTTQESADAIRAAYAPILHDPIVTVELRDFNRPYFVVSGQVNRPGKYDLRGETSAAEAVAIAGGFTEAARHSQVLLFRRANSSWYEVKSLNLKRALQGHGSGEDTTLRAGDLLYVPQNSISKFRRFIPSSGVGAYYQLRP